MADLLDGQNVESEAEHSGLGLVSRLLELPRLGAGDGLRGRQWFSRGGMSPYDRSGIYSQSAGQATPTNYSATLDISHDISMHQGYALRDLHLAPTPAHDVTCRRPHLHNTQLLEDTILGEDATTMEDPTRRVSGDLVMAFHRELSVHCRPSQCLDLAMALEKCCEVQCNILTDFEKETRLSVDQMQAELRMEVATWQLFHVLGRDRMEETTDDMMLDVLGENGLSDKEIADQLFARSSFIRQTQLVVDWLEGLARVGLEQFPVKAVYFTDNVCFENTLHDLKHATDRAVLVTELDPDAPTRQQRKLSELDVRDELSLNKHLFVYLRAGQFYKAQELCVKSGQGWKAMTLLGWKLHHDPNNDKNELGQVEGNTSRDIWKLSCWEMLNESAYDVYEKAMYGSLCGNVETVLPACQTWYDYVWAYFKRLVDVQVEKALRSRAGRDMLELPSQYWANVLLPHQIFQEIEATPSTDVQRQCQSHFHLIQKYIILNDLNGLVCEMATWLSSRLSIHRLRFMAHISLVARGLGGLREDSKVDAILEAYVKALTEGHYQSVVALYAAQLPAEGQVFSYAHLLKGVQQEDMQRHCLQLGKEAGLDITMVTKAVVENIVQSAELDEEQHVGSLQLGQEVKLSRLDQSKVTAINWLLYDETQRYEAIKQGNALIRQFLTARKYSAAHAVFQKIPADSAQVVTQLWQHKAGVSQHVASDLTQLQAIGTYMDAKEAFNAWFQHFHHKKPEKPIPTSQSVFHEKVAFEHHHAQYELEYEQWKSQDDVLTQAASTKLNDVLMFPGGWMSGDKVGDKQLLQQFQALRQTCIPEICFLLHSVLHSVADYQQCLQICDFVMSEDHKLYQDFRPSELGQLLLLMQKTALAASCDPQL